MLRSPSRPCEATSSSHSAVRVANIIPPKAVLETETLAPPPQGGQAI